MGEEAASGVSLGGLVRLLLADYQLQRRRSAYRAEYGLDHVLRYFGRSTDAASITYDRLLQYATHRLGGKERAAAATVSQELALLRRAYKLAERSGKVKPPYFPTIKLDNARKGFIDRPAFECLRQRLPEYLRPLATFLYITGWRREEALSLTWRQVDFDEGVVRLEPGTTKNGEGREFPFSVFPELQQVLRVQQADTRIVEIERSVVIGWVFHHDGGKRLKDFRRGWHTACERCGVGGALLHDFRRSAVRNLERAGVPRSVAMALTGHRTEAVYRRYAITARTDLEDGVRKLAALFARDENLGQRVFSLDSATRDEVSGRRIGLRASRRSG
jgi:integrase